MITAIVVTSKMDEEMLQKCIDSLHGHDELLIAYNNPEQLRNYPVVVNEAVQKAQGEYIVFVCDDTEVIKGTIDSLCGEGIYFPVVKNEGYPFYCPSFFGCPKKWFIQDEQYELFYCDYEMFLKVRRMGKQVIQLNSVVITHKKMFTRLKIRTPEEDREIYNRDRGRFFNKWEEELLK
jgi:glycosyltransferase involved in cell wall biosynthesis